MVISFLALALDDAADLQATSLTPIEVALQRVETAVLTGNNAAVQHWLSVTFYLARSERVATAPSLLQR